MTEIFIKLAEKYLTIERPENDVVIDESNISDELEFAHTKECTLKYQFHSHRKNCIFKDEFHNTLCKYHFPHPILEETVVLEPFNPEDFVQTIENKKGKPINVKDDYYKLFIKINNQLELIVSKTIREEIANAIEREETDEKLTKILRSIIISLKIKETPKS